MWSAKQRVQDYIVEIAILLGSFVPGITFLMAYPRVISVLFLAAGLAFGAAYLFGTKKGKQHYTIVLGGILLPGTLGATCLHRLSVPEAFENGYAFFWFFAAFLAVGSSQEWFELPGYFSQKLQRILALPWTMFLAVTLNLGIDYAVETLWFKHESIGFALFILLGILPICFVYFTVMPASLIDQEDVTMQRWLWRYILLLASSCLSMLFFWVLF